MFFASRKDMAVADAGAIARGGSAGLSRAGGGSAGADRRPTSFPDMSSPSRTSWLWIRSGSGRNTSGRSRCPWQGRGSVSGGGQTCHWRDFSG
jgi:hypothetical protein